MHASTCLSVCVCGCQSYLFTQLGQVPCVSQTGDSVWQVCSEGPLVLRMGVLNAALVFALSTRREGTGGEGSSGMVCITHTVRTCG